MEIFYYKPGSDKVEDGFTESDLPRLLEDKDAVVWVDFLGETPEQNEEARRVMLNIFRFHAITVDDSMETRNQPKIEPYSQYIYLVVHGVKPETDPTNFVTKELDAFLGPNFVVTYHIERFQSIKIVKQHIRTGPFACERGAAYLLYQILDHIVDLYMPLVEDFDLVINHLEDRVLDIKSTDPNVLEEVMDLRRSVARLRRISTRQLEVLYRMSHSEFRLIPDNILPFFRDVHDHLLRISDLSESYRDLVSSLFEIHFAVIANRTNDVMKTLAVVSAILLPLTLIAGIYGMNFDNMPELHSRHGYFLTLAVMAIITIVLLFYFWKRGWIFQKEYDPQQIKDADD